MWVSLPLVLALWVLHATAAWAGPWTGPGEVLGVAWGAPVEVASQQLPGGQLRQETPLITTYSTATHVEGIPLSASFQFVAQQGLQGVILRFPVHRLPEMVAVFERQYGLAPIRGNEQWRWEGTSVRIALGEYPNLRIGGRRGIAWFRTGVLEAAIAGGDETAWSPEQGAPSVAAPRPAQPQSQAGYEERLVRKIYWTLRYPATTHGVYQVMLTFRLTPAGRPAAIELTVDPPNPEVAESVRTALSRAQPFPLPPSGDDQRVTLGLTVTIMP